MAVATLTKPVPALAVVVVAGGVVGFISSARPIVTAPIHLVQAPPFDVSIPRADIPGVSIRYADITGSAEMILIRPESTLSPDPHPVRVEVP
jgi:hypothetical protein